MQTQTTSQGKHRFKIHDLVLKAIPVRSKYKDYYEGPFKIVKTNPAQNTFIVEKDLKIISANIKQLIPVPRKKMNVVP